MRKRTLIRKDLISLDHAAVRQHITTGAHTRTAFDSVLTAKPTRVVIPTRESFQDQQTQKQAEQLEKHNKMCISHQGAPCYTAGRHALGGARQRNTTNAGTSHCKRYA